LQEAFINIWRFASDYRQSVSAPMAWMVAIVRHRALDYLRQRKVFAADAETSRMQSGPLISGRGSLIVKNATNGLIIDIP
jgi:DNA-directed RNA polymerase specialized sigma24 family protein